MDENMDLSKNAEINQALQEFQAKASQEQISQVGQNTPQVSEVSAMVRFVIKLSSGAIKRQKQAEYFLLGFVILAVGISLFLFFGGEQTQQKPSAAALEQIKQMHINQ